MTTIETIRAEIERLKSEAWDSILPDEPKYLTHYKIGRKEVCADILAFLDTLPEQPASEDLDAEIERYWNWVTGFQPSFAVLELTKDDLAKVARHFAEWGMNQMPLPEDTTIFQKGVAEGKRLMMESAVDGRYMKANEKVYVESWPLDIDPNSVKAGDEVKLIVIPKEK